MFNIKSRERERDRTMKSNPVCSLPKSESAASGVCTPSVSCNSLAIYRKAEIQGIHQRERRDDEVVASSPGERGRQSKDPRQTIYYTKWRTAACDAKCGAQR